MLVLILGYALFIPYVHVKGIESDIRHCLMSRLANKDFVES